LCETTDTQPLQEMCTDGSHQGAHCVVHASHRLLRSRATLSPVCFSLRAAPHIAVCCRPRVAPQYNVSRRGAIGWDFGVLGSVGEVFSAVVGATCPISVLSQSFLLFQESISRAVPAGSKCTKHHTHHKSFYDAPPCAAYLPCTCVPAVRLFLVVMASHVLSQPVLCVARRPEPTDARSSVSTTASGARCDQFVCLLTSLVSATPNCTVALRVADMMCCGSPRAPTRTTMTST
jgi:hypothetical protein